MKDMRRQDLLEWDPVGEVYRPGFLLYQLGMIYQAHLNIFELVTTTVRRLVDTTGHTAYIGILEGGDILALSMIEGRHPVRYNVVAGERHPAYTITSGKCLLSRMSDEAIAALYADPLDERYPKAPRTVAELLDQIRVIRRTGWSETDVSSLPNVRAIGVSIASADEREAFGYSLSWQNGALSKREIEQLRGEMVQSAIKLAEQTRDPFWIKFFSNPLA
jgi:IclR family transcriptional regulator, KDG regulon repressor